MPTKVLVVDDSAFFRRRIKEILEQSPEITVVGFAANGKEGIEQTKLLAPDVITMDYEMPVMDGITAVKTIMAEHPTPILMFSSLSYDGARVTLDALEAGALDYLPKSFEAMASSAANSTKLLQDRVMAISRRKPFLRKSTTTPLSHRPLPSTPVTPSPTIKPSNKNSESAIQHAVETLQGKRPRLLLIGASTGGPIALQKILMALPAKFPIPIIMIQHMPRTFTSAFAERLNRLCQIDVKEAADNDSLEPGKALLAPGGMQLLINSSGHSISIVESNEQIPYRPSVDITFGSAARYVKGKILAVVLTGMGQDGREGCKALKRVNATIWTQDEQSCVVYGMPMAVASAGLSDAVLAIDDIGPSMSELR